MLGALVVVGLLVAAVGRDVVRAWRASRMVAVAADVDGSTEAALLRSWAGWPAPGVATLAPGEAREWSVTEDSAEVRLRVVRLGAELFQLDARAAVPLGAGDASGRSVAHRAQALLLDVRPALLPLRAVVVSGGDVAGGGLSVSARDSMPPGWDCAPPDGVAVPAVVAPHGAVIDVVLSPPDSVARDDAAGAAGSYVLAPPDTLAPRSTRPLVVASPAAGAHVRPAIDAAGECVVGAAAPHNWGDPARPSPCAAHLPVVRVAGDLVAPAGRSQGVLIVDGDLELAGGYEHWGVVVVHGRLRAAGGGNRIFGALLARRGIAASDPGALAVRHSSCAVRAARGAAGIVMPVTGAAWREWW
ncbi:MAG TPA: hypothetical protein VGE02_04525 [Gemmatimonadales bacterium]